MESAHIDPEQAVIIHKELKSKKSVGVHWGTFPLGFEHYLQPREDLAKAKVKHGVPED
jgi:N-acyl-phosphatidylethanolamine-hydrolysing phospholipase D